MRVAPADHRDARVGALIERHLDLMRSITPPENVFAQDALGLIRDGARLFTVSDASQAILGIGAYKIIEPAHAELKSMHVVAEARGRGAGGALLEQILEAARGEGAMRASLETGRAAAFTPALELYRRAGFTPCGPFGGYVDNPFSVFLSRALSGERPRRS
ncbi:MAG: GNAT family N-acetyltransferase [Pseudomonadota bacterium]